MKKPFLLIAGGFVFFLLITLGGGLWYLVSQPNYTESKKVRLVIAKGESPTLIAKKLYNQGLVYHPLVFQLAVRATGTASQLKAGSFTIEGRLSPAAIAQRLTQRPEDTWIKLLEGWRREEMADYLATQELTAFDRQEFLSLTKDKEGYLFPDTYLVPKEITTEALVNLLLNTFDKKVKQGLANELSQSERSLNQLVIIASLLEREAKGYDQMRHVAGIIYNRLKLGMPLQLDATLQYLRGWDEKARSYWSPPSVVLKKSTSPYNTYLYLGLPPTPIANPGLSAIKAALNPLETDDLYYLHAPDGKIYYAKTLEKHNQNIKHYLQ